MFFKAGFLLLLVTWQTTLVASFPVEAEQPAIAVEEVVRTVDAAAEKPAAVPAEESPAKVDVVETPQAVAEVKEETAVAAEVQPDTAVKEETVAAEVRPDAVVKEETVAAEVQPDAVVKEETVAAEVQPDAVVKEETVAAEEKPAAVVKEDKVAAEEKPESAQKEEAVAAQEQSDAVAVEKIADEIPAEAGTGKEQLAAIPQEESAAAVEGKPETPSEQIQEEVIREEPALPAAAEEQLPVAAPEAKPDATAEEQPVVKTDEVAAEEQPNPDAVVEQSDKVVEEKKADITAAEGQPDIAAGADKSESVAEEKVDSVPAEETPDASPAVQAEPIADVKEESEKTAAEEEEPAAVEPLPLPVPQIPAIIAEAATIGGLDDLGYVWRHVIRKETPVGAPVTRVAEAQTPQTVVTVRQAIEGQLLPIDISYNPLYQDNYIGLSRDFVLDQLSAERFNSEDPALLTPDGLTLNSLSGKPLQFVKNPETGIIFLNGVEVVSLMPYEGGITAIELSDFLFTHREDIRAAFDELGETYEGPIYDSFGRVIKKEEEEDKRST